MWIQQCGGEYVCVTLYWNGARAWKRDSVDKTEEINLHTHLHTHKVYYASCFIVNFPH